MKVKKIISLLLASALTVLSLPVTFAADLELASPSAVLIEAKSGQVLYEKDCHQKLPPASVTKIMTMLLTMEAIDSGKIKYEDKVRCSEYAASMGGSQIYLEPGEEMTVHDMLKGVAVASGNDAAVALSEFIAGSTEGFVEKMNERAKELGMNDTHFVNCNGLDDPEHLTTAYDIALMSKELISHSGIFEFTSIWMDSLRNGEFGLVNTNKLIRFYEGANGLKTGSTSVAKYCLSASAKRENLNLIAVIMASPSSKERFSDASKLLDYGFANYAIADSLISDDELKEVKVKKGAKTALMPQIKSDDGILIAKDKLNSIEKKTNICTEISAPIKKGDKLGIVEYYSDGKKIGASDIISGENISRISIFQVFMNIANHILCGA